MESCQDNPFCCKLHPDVRQRLCKHCIKTSFAARSKMHIDFEHPFLVLEGVICATTRGKVGVILSPGDLLLPPSFRPAAPLSQPLSEREMEKEIISYGYYFPTPVTVATFSQRVIRQLMDDARFVRQLLDSVLHIQTEETVCQTHLYHGSALDAVKYILRVARAYDLGKLTHDQIAFLSGRSRVTVTKTMHEIALSEPELLAE